MNIVEAVKAKGASLRILAMHLDTGSPTAQLMLGILGSVAQFEREIALERQREGIAKAHGPRPMTCAGSVRKASAPPRLPSGSGLGARACIGCCRRRGNLVDPIRVESPL